MNEIRKRAPRCKKRNVDFRLYFLMKMKSWRVWLGSFWAHVEIMWCHCGHLGHTWRTWRAILATKGAWRAPSSAKGGQWEANIEISGVKRGHKGPWGLTRADKGCVPAACGEPLGEGRAKASPLVLGINSARPNHAKAWGGGYNCYAHSAGPCMGRQGNH